MMKRLAIILILIGICVTGAAAKQFTLVIDAGHGGRDAGALGSKSKEKDLTLKFALAFGRMVERNCPDVKVVYTRKTDVFVPLWQRAEIANKAKADLFISVHINSVGKGHSARGFQTYTLGRSIRTGKKNGVQENLEVAKRENDVIYLEANYKQTYKGFDPNSAESNIMFEFVQDKNMENSIELAKYMQRYVCQATKRQDMGAHQDNLAVLRLTSMPGCLIELGFISNRDEENFMNSKGAEDMYARGIYNAFLAYWKNHGGNQLIPYQKETPKKEEAPKKEETPKKKETAPAETAPKDSVAPKEESVAPKEPATAGGAIVFKVQILTSDTRLRTGDTRLKGRKDADYYQDGRLYKYTVGASEDYNAIYRLRKELVGQFPQAFIVAFRDGERMDLNEAIREFKKSKQ